MISRKIEGELINLAGQYPVVTIIGPRQSGKTTLAKATFADYNYVNLELPDIRHFALNDPRGFFSTYKPPLIIDEIQRAGELLSYIQVFVDKKNENGSYILTESNQLQLSENITQSLAGRTAILKLLPFSLSELEGAGIVLSRDEYITRGFLPRIYDKDLEPFKAYGNYLETYVEKDLKRQINIKNLTNFQNFLKLLAGRVGQVINLNSLSNDVGVTSTTLSEWLSVLEASFIIHRITPYFENFGKRIIKSPKIYFTEIGLAAYLLNLQNAEQVSRDPLLGGLFENLIVNELLKMRYNKGMPANLYFFRDNHGNEVDVLFASGRKITPIEIKSAMTFNHKMLKSIQYFQKLTADADKGYLIYAGQEEFQSDSYEVKNFRQLKQIMH